MSVCSDLLDEIVGAQGRFNNAGAEVTRLGEQLTAVFADMAVADGDIVELTNQISAIDGEIVGIKDEARRRQIADIDERLRAIEERIAELLLALNGGDDTPPASVDHAPVLAAELLELESAADALAARRVLLANRLIEADLTADEQDAIDAKTTERGTAEQVRDDVQRFREELTQDETDLKALQDIQFDLQDAAVEEREVLEAEALEAGCGFDEGGDPDAPEMVDGPSPE